MFAGNDDSWAGDFVRNVKHKTQVFIKFLYLIKNY